MNTLTQYLLIAAASLPTGFLIGWFETKRIRRDRKGEETPLSWFDGKDSTKD